MSSLSDYSDPLSSEKIKDLRNNNFPLLPELFSPFRGEPQDFSLYGTFLITKECPSLGPELSIRNIRCLVEDHYEHGIFLSVSDIKRPKAINPHFLKPSSSFENDSSKGLRE